MNYYIASKQQTSKSYLFRCFCYSDVVIQIPTVLVWLNMSLIFYIVIICFKGGLTQIRDSDNQYSKLFWLFILISGTILTFVSVQFTVSSYLQFNVTINIDYVNQVFTPFNYDKTGHGGSVVERELGRKSSTSYSSKPELKS